MAVVLAAAIGTVAGAEPAPFDLAGPDLQIKVTRGAQTLPIAQVPHLAVGDRVWIHADMPPTQSAHYLLVTAFLRGATNPPPQEWFFSCETWAGKCAQEGLTVTIPAGAQQVLVFLAPQTGGDFRTLVSAVRGRPGAFVRTSQDLNQASLDRARLDQYLAAIRALNDSDPGRLKEAAPLLARSLAIKVDDKCLERSAVMQAPCLMQGQNSLILNDGHSTSIVEALTSGPASDLAMEASYTPQLSYGYYSPYIASVLDIARIMDSFRTAQYQYIPALTTPHEQQLALTLNTPPSFNNPKSVLVTALPAVEQPQLPPLHAVDPKETYCARKSSLALPVEGAPLVFSTGYAHNMTLTLAGEDGKSVDLPVQADPELGGFILNTNGLQSLDQGRRMQGSLHGYWGFEKYVGPSFEFANVPAPAWELAANEDAGLIAGRDRTIRIQGGSISCVDTIRLKGPDGRQVDTVWRPIWPDQVEVTLPLQSAKPGTMTLLVSQYGLAQPQSLPLRAFAEAAHFDRFAIHAGDSQGVLRGSRLDEVSSLNFQGIEFVPGKLSSSQGTDELVMTAQDPQAIVSLPAGSTAPVKVALSDGRILNLTTSVEASRPRVTLIGTSVQPSASSSSSKIQLAGQDELPQDSKLTFSVHAQSPASFAIDERLEVATADGSASTTLSISNGGITLVDSKVAVLTLDPIKSLGPSAFGPLQFRTIVDDVVGDWQPLVTLVRLPVLTELKCPASADLACKLSGANLFLVDSLSEDPQFTHSVQVPEGFPGYSLPVPHPSDGSLYVKLRDDPSVVSRAVLEVHQVPAAPDEASRAAVRHEAAQTAPPTQISAAQEDPAKPSPQ
jgi:hypothetical protein